MFNVRKFLDDYNIKGETEGPNTAPNWIQIKCPFCNDHSNHGGFNILTGYYNCWKCGKHPIIEVIKNLININNQKAYEIYKQYQNELYYKEEKTHTKVGKIKLPEFVTRMRREHHDYLRQRGFDSKKIEKQFNLLGTNHIGDYKFRIIAPIYVNKFLVSYQGRDITNRAYLRYKACSKMYEVIHHKHTLYNLDNSCREKVIVVEGITDVWRLGDNCVCTFGIQFTLEQVLVLAQKYKQVFIIYDKGENEYEQSKKLAKLLSGLRVKSYIIRIEEKDGQVFVKG